jgi:hypothetical protein
MTETYPQKSTFGAMREMGVPGVLVYIRRPHPMASLVIASAFYALVLAGASKGPQR